MLAFINSSASLSPYRGLLKIQLEVIDTVIISQFTSRYGNYPQGFKWHLTQESIWVTLKIFVNVNSKARRMIKSQEVQSSVALSTQVPLTQLLQSGSGVWSRMRGAGRLKSADVTPPPQGCSHRGFISYLRVRFFAGDGSSNE